MKKLWKRFWTLRKRQSGGFTLVELIVVIAILAILAGVGVPVYSGYVKKANMQADMTLIGDIIRAGETSFYSNFAIPTEAAGSVYGYVVVTETGVKTDDPKIDQALKDAFGATYGSNVLKSEEWTTSAALATLNSVAAMENVAGSSFVLSAGIDNLMGDVQHCASSLAKFLDGFNLGGQSGIDALDDNIGGDYVQEYLKNYSGEITTDVLSNAVVFGLADQLKNDTVKANEVKTNMANGNYILRNWSSNNGTSGLGTYDPEKALNYLDESDTDLLTQTAATYAALEAFSAYIGYEMQLEFTGDNTMAILSQLADECNKAMNYATDNNYPDRNAKAMAYLTGGQAAKDADAYLEVMQTVSAVKNDYAGELTNTNLFGGDEMINRVNGYVAFSTVDAAASTIAALFGSDEYGVAIVFTVTKDGKINSIVFQAAADPRG